MTVSEQEFRKWLEAHAADIRRITTDIGNMLNTTAKGGLDLLRDIAGWFDKLTGSQKEVAAALALIGASFLSPGWARMAAIAYVLEKLLTDYEKFKQTGTSDLGIPWAKIGDAIDTVVTKFAEVNDATGGWFNALDLIGAYVAGSLLLRFLTFFGAVRTAAVATATTINSSLGASLLRTFPPASHHTAAVAEGRHRTQGRRSSNAGGARQGQGPSKSLASVLGWKGRGRA